MPYPLFCRILHQYLKISTKEELKNLVLSARNLFTLSLKCSEHLLCDTNVILEIVAWSVTDYENKHLRFC